VFLGKLIGGIIGYSLWGFWGGLLGFWLGSAFDRAAQLNSIFISSSDRENLQQSFFKTTFQLIGHIAKADGLVSKAEIAQTESLMSRMGLTQAHRKQAIEYFQEGTVADFNYDLCITQFAQISGRNRQLPLTLLEFLISIALADGHLDPAEQTVLRNTAAKLNMNAQQFEQLLQMILAQNHFNSGSGSYNYNSQAPRADALKQAYQALGISADIDDKGLKKSYRKLMSQHHPDKLIAKGVPDDMIKVATEKSQQIQSAYELIKKSRA